MCGKTFYERYKMGLEQLKCPACGADKLESRIENGETVRHCAYCGIDFTDFSGVREYEKLESAIKAGLGSVVDEALVRERTNKYYNLRSMLWGKITAKYIDSAAIVSICRDILSIAQHDFLAEFFEIANSGSREEIAEYIGKIDATENALLIDLVLNFIISSLKEEYITPTAALLDRCGKVFSPQKKQEFVSRFEAEAAKVAEGIYEVALARDVFLAYSSKDMPAVIDVLNFIESNGLSCFAAFRNLQHGRDAVMNYERALEEAIDHCSIFLFVSSVNSRSFSCDAFKKEMPYIRNSEMKEHREYRSYEQLPEKYKKLRIEYRLDNKPTPLADRTLKEFFAGLTYAEDYDQLVARLGECMDRLSASYEEEEEEPTPAPQASANPFNFNDKESFAEMIRMINEENKKAEEETRRKIEEEYRQKAEAKAKALVSARQNLVNVLSATLAKKRREKAIEDRKKTIAEINRKAEAEAERQLEARRKAIAENNRRIEEEAKRQRQEEMLKAQAEAKRKADEEAKRRAAEAAALQREQELARQRAEQQRLQFDAASKQIKNEVAARSEIRNGVLVKYNGAAEKIVIPDGVKTIGENAFKSCNTIKSVVIGADVTTIESFAFAYCTNLTQVTIQDPVKVIGSYSFASCSNLSQINLGNVTEIQYQAFNWCSKLTTVHIPASVTKVDGESFSWCKGLTSITVDARNPKFKSVDGNLYTKDGYGILKYACAKKDKTFTVPEGIHLIGEHAFDSSVNLTTVSLPSTVTVIDGMAFYGCDNLSKINIPEGVTTIDSYAFSGCKSMYSITLPRGLKKANLKAFNECTSLTIYIHPDTDMSGFDKTWHGGRPLCNSVTLKPFAAGGLFKKLFKK